MSILRLAGNRNGESFPLWSKAISAGCQKSFTGDPPFPHSISFRLVQHEKNLDILKSCGIKQIFLGRIAKESFPSFCIKRQIRKKSEIEGAFGLFDGLALEWYEDPKLMNS